MNHSCECITLNGELVLLCDEHQRCSHSALKRGIEIGRKQEQHRVLDMIKTMQDSYGAPISTAHKTLETLRIEITYGRRGDE